MEELKALTEQIVADGETPWCIGLGSGGATGWPATDWVEDMMLRTQPPDVYDQWVSNEIPFDDPARRRRHRGIRLVRPQRRVSLPAAPARSPPPTSATAPRASSHRRRSATCTARRLHPGLLPEGTEVGVDADFFYFPAYAEQGSRQAGSRRRHPLGDHQGQPGRAGADHRVLSATPIAHEVWMAQKGFLTPLQGVNTDLFADPTLRKMNDILLGATTFRFDASDLMPGGVGAGSFWTGMVDYTGGKPPRRSPRRSRSWDALK
jgi:alpha-glucoside transport system substrate-binding protein